MVRLWSEEETVSLRRYWSEGLSASQIAMALRTGRSRNSVIGRVHRLGLAGRASQSPFVVTKAATARRRSASPPMRAPRVSHVAPPPPDTPERRAIAALQPIDPNLTIDKLSNFTCRYPIGDPLQDGFAFCGRTCEADEPYCRSHAQLTYTRITKQRLNGMERLTRWLDGQGKRAGMSA